MFCLSFVWFSLTNFVQGDHPTELDLFSPWDKVESIHSHKRIPGDPGSACREFHKPGPYGSSCLCQVTLTFGGK